MSSLAQLLGAGNGPVTSIVNAFSAGGASASLSTAVTGNTSVLASSAGALTANTLKSVLSLTGRGSLRFAGAFATDTTSRTIRLKVTIDGASIFDATTNAITATNTGIIGVGTVATSALGYISVMMQPITFQSSCLVQVASSLTETDKVGSMLNYEVWG